MGTYSTVSQVGMYVRIRKEAKYAIFDAICYNKTTVLIRTIFHTLMSDANIIIFVYYLQLHRTINQHPVIYYDTLEFDIIIILNIVMDVCRKGILSLVRYQVPYCNYIFSPKHFLMNITDSLIPYILYLKVPTYVTSVCKFFIYIYYKNLRASNRLFLKLPRTYVRTTKLNRNFTVNTRI